MKKIFVTLSAVLLAFSLLAILGCGDDDDPVDPPIEACSISVSTPGAGSIFKPGDPDFESVSIRWAATGGATTVTIELLKGGTPVGIIVSETANDEFYAWTANNMGAPNGTDFSIRVTADGEDDCQGSTAYFSMTNLVGCGIVFTNDFPEETVAGEVLTLTWDSEYTNGFVDILLRKAMTTEDEDVGFIVEDLADDGSFEWTVDSLNAGSFGSYYLRIWDADLEMACYSDSVTFGIYDDDICTIRVDNPQDNDVYDIGDEVDILMSVSPEVTRVNIKLYKGNERLGEIIMGLELVPGNPHFLWTVTDFGNDETFNRYNVKIFNVDDEYCAGHSASFTINH